MEGIFEIDQMAFKFRQDFLLLKIPNAQLWNRNSFFFKRLANNNPWKTSSKTPKHNRWKEQFKTKAHISF